MKDFENESYIQGIKKPRPNTAVNTNRPNSRIKNNKQKSVTY